MIRVTATDLADYLRRYYRRDRMTPASHATYAEELAKDGYVCTSHHDSATGKFIGWSPDWARVDDTPVIENHCTECNEYESECTCGEG